MSELNYQGGLIPDAKDRKRAKAADLGTLPVDIPGTNCGNCKFIKPEGYISSNVIFGFCNHPKVLQEVTNRMCCAFWDNAGYRRDW